MSAVRSLWVLLSMLGLAACAATAPKPVVTGAWRLDFQGSRIGAGPDTTACQLRFDLLLLQYPDMPAPMGNLNPLQIHCTSRNPAALYQDASLTVIDSDWSDFNHIELSLYVAWSHTRTQLVGIGDATTVHGIGTVPILVDYGLLPLTGTFTLYRP